MRKQEKNQPLSLALVLHPAERQCQLWTQLDYLKQQTPILGNSDTIRGFKDVTGSNKN